MNNKLIAAAIAAAMAAPAAYADATVYGQLKLHIDSTGGTGGESMSTSGSRLGFKGSEDLGNGMKAVFKLEYGLNFDDPALSTIATPVGTVATGGDAAGITSRSQYVGIAGNFGTFMFGKRETNFLLSTSKLDMFADTMADYNNVVGFDESGNLGNGGARPNDAIHYVSPTFSGLSISAGLYGDDVELNGNGYDIAASYKNGGIHASVAHASNEATSADATRIGLGYKMDAFKVALIWEDDNGTDKWQVQGAYAMGNNTLKAAYGDNDATGDSWVVALDHKMSKRTNAYVLYADSDNSLNSENRGDLSGFSLGMVHKF
jgi:predicted porin